MDGRHQRSRRACAAGFTLVELIAVLVVVGVLAFVVVPRYTSGGFDERGFRDAVKSTLQHARRTAIASRRYVCVTVTPGTGAAGNLAVTIDTTAPEGAAAVDCSTTPPGAALPLPSPGDGCTPAVANQLCAPASVVLTLVGSNVIFDPLGVPVTAAKVAAGALAVTVNGLPISITPLTGWIQ